MCQLHTDDVSCGTDGGRAVVVAGTDADADAVDCDDVETGAVAEAVDVDLVGNVMLMIIRQMKLALAQVLIMLTLLRVL